PASVFERDAGNVRCRLSISRLPAFECDLSARRQVLFSPTSPIQSVRAAGFERPIHNLAIFADDIHINPAVRVGPLHFRELSRQFDWLILIVLRRKRMMCESRTRE